MEKVRRIGEKILVATWNFICNLIEIICFAYAVALGRITKISSGAISVFSAIATAITGGFIALLIFGNSFIWTGCLYFMFSMAKHFAILLASDKGDWYHWMTGGIYSLFKFLKEDLLSTNGFAQFLSDLNGNFVTKIFQIVLLFACVACMIGLIRLFYKCLRHTVETIIDCIYNHSSKEKRKIRHKRKGNVRNGKRGNNKIVIFNDFKNKKVI